MSISITFTAADASALRQQLHDFLGTTALTATGAAPVAAVVGAPATVAAAPAVGGNTSTGPATAPTPAQSAPVQPNAALSNETTTVAPAADSPAPAPAPATDAPKALDYNADIKPAVLKVSGKFGREGIEKLLAPFGVTNAQQIPAERWPELLANVNAMLAAA